MSRSLSIPAMLIGIFPLCLWHLQTSASEVASYIQSRTNHWVASLELDPEKVELLTTEGFRGLHPVKIGDQMGDVLSAIGLHRLDSAKVLATPAFRERLGFLSPDSTVVWTDDMERPDGFPGYYIAVFGPEEAQHLSDLLRFSDGDVIPLREGLYCQRLAQIRKGTSTDQIYRLLGRLRPDTYVADARGRWRIVFRIHGFRGRIHRIVVDAGTGKVIDVQNMLY